MSGRTSIAAKHSFQPFPVARTKRALDAFSHPARLKVTWIGSPPLELGPAGTTIAGNPVIAASAPDSVPESADRQRLR
jgi:hypothetical protein